MTSGSDGVGGIREGDTIHKFSEGDLVRSRLKEPEKVIYDILSKDYGSSNKWKALRKAIKSFFVGELSDDGARATLFNAFTKIFEESKKDRDEIIKVIDQIDKKTLFKEYLITFLLQNVKKKSFYNPQNENDKEVADYVYDELIKGVKVGGVEKDRDDFIVKHSFKKAGLNRGFSLEQEKNLVNYLKENERGVLKETLLKINSDEQVRLSFREIRLLLSYFLEKLFGGEEQLNLNELERKFFTKNFSEDVLKFIEDQNRIKEDGLESDFPLGYIEDTYSRPDDLKSVSEAYEEITNLTLAKFAKNSMEEIPQCEKELVFRSILAKVREKKKLGANELTFAARVLIMHPLPEGSIEAAQEDKAEIAKQIKTNLDATTDEYQKAFLALELFESKQDPETLQTLSPIAASSTKQKLYENLLNAQATINEVEKTILIKSLLEQLKTNADELSSAQTEFLIKSLVDDKGEINSKIIGEEYRDDFEKLIKNKAQDICNTALSQEITIDKEKIKLVDAVKSVRDKKALLSKEMEELRANSREELMEAEWQKRALHANMNRIIKKLNAKEQIRHEDKLFAAYYLDSHTYNLLFGQEAEMYKTHHTFCTRKNLQTSLLPSMIKELGLDEVFKSYTPILQDLFSRFNETDNYRDGRSLSLDDKGTITQKLHEEYSSDVADFTKQFFTYSLSKRRKLTRKFEEIKENLERELPKEVFSLMEKETVQFDKIYKARKKVDKEFEAAFSYLQANRENFEKLKEGAKRNKKAYKYYLACQLIAEERFIDERYYVQKKVGALSREGTAGAEACLKEIEGFKPPEGAPSVEELIQYVTELKKKYFEKFKTSEKVVRTWLNNKKNLRAEIAHKSKVAKLYDPVRVAEEVGETVQQARINAGVGISRNVMNFNKAVTDKMKQTDVIGRIGEVASRSLTQFDLYVRKLTDNISVLIEAETELVARKKKLEVEVEDTGDVVGLHKKLNEIKNIKEEIVRVDGACKKLIRNLELFVEKDDDPLPTSKKGWFGKIRTCTFKSIKDAKALASLGYGWTSVKAELKEIVKKGPKGIIKEFGNFANWLRKNPEEAENMATDIAILISALKSFNESGYDVGSLIDDIQSACQAATLADHFTRGYGAPEGSIEKVEGKATYILTCRAISIAPMLVSAGDAVTDIVQKGWRGLFTGAFKMFKTAGIKKMTEVLTVDQMKMVTMAIAGYKGGLAAVKRQEMLYESVQLFGEIQNILSSKSPWKAFTSRLKWRARSWWLKITKEENRWIKAMRIGVGIVIPTVAVVGGVALIGVAVGGTLAAALLGGATLGAALIPAIAAAGTPAIIALGVIIGGIWMSRRLYPMIDVLVPKTIKKVKAQIVEERTRELTVSLTEFDEKFNLKANADAEDYVKILAKSIVKDSDELFAWEKIAIEHSEKTFRKVTILLNVGSLEEYINRMAIEEIKSRLAEKFLDSVREESRIAEEEAIEKEVNRRLERLECAKLEDWEKAWQQELNKDEKDLEALRKLYEKRAAKGLREQLGSEDAVSSRIENIKESIKQRFVADRRDIWLKCFVNKETIDDLDNILNDKKKCKELLQQMVAKQKEEKDKVKKEQMKKAQEDFKKAIEGAKEEDVEKFKELVEGCEGEFNKRLDPQIVTRLKGEN